MPNEILSVPPKGNFTPIERRWLSDVTNVVNSSINRRFFREVKEVSKHYTLTERDEILLVNALANPLTISLPNIDGDDGRTYHIKKIDASANVITIVPSGNALIEGGTSFTITTPLHSRMIVSLERDWWVV